jgi:hypothetical protein
MHTKLKNIAGNLFKVKNRLFEREQLLDENILSKLMNQISIAESNLIKCINYDFNIETPNKVLYEVWENYFKHDIDILNLTKVLILDAFRTGVSLFYETHTITIACLIAGNHLLNGKLIPPAKNGENQMVDDIYQQPTNNGTLDDIDNSNSRIPTYKIDQLLPPSFMLSLEGYDSESINKQFADKKHESKIQNQKQTRKIHSEEQSLAEWIDKVKPGIKLREIWGELIRDYIHDKRPYRFGNPGTKRSLITLLEFVM